MFMSDMKYGTTLFEKKGFFRRSSISTVGVGG